MGPRARGREARARGQPPPRARRGRAGLLRRARPASSSPATWWWRTSCAARTARSPATAPRPWRGALERARACGARRARSLSVERIARGVEAGRAGRRRRDRRRHGVGLARAGGRRAPVRRAARRGRHGPRHELLRAGTVAARNYARIVLFGRAAGRLSSWIESLDPAPRRQRAEMAVPLRQTRARRHVPDEAAACARGEVPAARRARAALPVQPRVRGLRQDPVPGGHPEDAACRSTRRVAAIEESGRADGVDRGRRAADPPGDPRDRGRADEAQEVRVPVHQRDPDEEEARPASSRRRTSPGSCTWTACASATTSRSAARACSTRPCDAIKEAKKRGFRVTTNTTFFTHDSPEDVREVLDFLNDELEVDADDDLAGLRLREGARPGALPGRRSRRASCSRRRSPTAAARSGA